MKEKNKKTGQLHSSLSKHILANNFNAAQALINEGIPFSNSIVYQILSRNNIEAFKFVIKNNITLTEDNIFEAFTDNITNSDKFKRIIITEKFKRNDLDNTFSNKEKFFIFLKKKTEHYTKSMHTVNILQKKNGKYNFFYNLTTPMEEILPIKEFVDNFETIIFGFYELTEFLPKLTKEEELYLLDIKNMANEAKEIYSNYIIDRLDLAKSLSPIIEKRDLLNNKIQDVIKEYNLLTEEKNKLKP